MERKIGRALLTILLFVAACLTRAPLAAAQAAPFCADGEEPHFSFGIAALHAAIGETMGDPIECEHPNSANGDTPFC